MPNARTVAAAISRKPVALVTGASAGIGAELARVFAANGYDLVLVARSEDKLRALADGLHAQHGARCSVVAQDLAAEGAPQKVFAETQRRDLPVDVLVNNAGLLHRGSFIDTELSLQMRLVQVNIVASTALAHLFLKPMLERRSGRILNIASTAAFQPLPYLSTYAASKAYLLFVSEALAIEARGTGVTVTAACPGFTNTDMIARDGGKAMNVPFVRNMEAAEVAQQSFDACMSGKPLLIIGLANRATVEIARYQPRPWRRWASLRVAKRGF